MITSFVYKWSEPIFKWSEPILHDCRGNQGSRKRTQGVSPFTRQTKITSDEREHWVSPLTRQSRIPDWRRRTRVSPFTRQPRFLAVERAHYSICTRHCIIYSHGECCDGYKSSEPIYTTADFTSAVEREHWVSPFTRQPRLIGCRKGTRNHLYTLHHYVPYRWHCIGT